MIRPLASVVPFAEGSGGIACSVECFGKRPFISVQPFQSSRDPTHAAARMIAAGEKLRARRRAQRTHIKPLERRPATRDRVDIRRAQVPVAANAVITPAGIIGQEDHDVGCRRRNGCGRGGNNPSPCTCGQHQREDSPKNWIHTCGHGQKRSTSEGTHGSVWVEGK